MTLDENMMCVAVWNYQGVIRKVCALVGFKGKPTQTKILEMYVLYCYEVYCSIFILQEQTINSQIFNFI